MTQVVLVGLVYLVVYVLLDRVSLYESYAPLGTTPWKPSTGLSLVLVLVFGRQFVTLLFVAPFLADFANRYDSLAWPTEIASVVTIAAGYSAALFFLTKRRIGFDPTLSSLRDVVLLILAATASAAFVASCHVSAIMRGLGFVLTHPGARRYPGAGNGLENRRIRYCASVCDNRHPLLRRRADLRRRRWARSHFSGPQLLRRSPDRTPCLIDHH